MTSLGASSASFSARLPLGLQPKSSLNCFNKKSSCRTPVLAPNAHTGMAEGQLTPQESTPLSDEFCCKLILEVKRQKVLKGADVSPVDCAAAGGNRRLAPRCHFHCCVFSHFEVHHENFLLLSSGE